MTKNQILRNKKTKLLVPKNLKDITLIFEISQFLLIFSSFLPFFGFRAYYPDFIFKKIVSRNPVCREYVEHECRVHDVYLY